MHLEHTSTRAQTHTHTHTHRDTWALVQLPLASDGQGKAVTHWALIRATSQRWSHKGQKTCAEILSFGPSVCDTGASLVLPNIIPISGTYTATLSLSRSRDRNQRKWGMPISPNVRTNQNGDVFKVGI